MDRKRIIGLVALVSLAGCARQSGPSKEVLSILAAHHSSDIDPEGRWFRLDPESTWVLRVRRSEDSATWSLRSAHAANGGATQGSPEVSTVSGRMEDGVLTVESPIAGSTRFHFCRFGDEELLLPESAVHFTGGGDEPPSGMVFRR